jgi:hypothetical protein
MPRVPNISDDRRSIPRYIPGRVENDPLPTVWTNPNVSASSFGGAQAKQLGDLAKALGEGGRNLQRLADMDPIQKSNAGIRRLTNEARYRMRTYSTEHVYTKRGAEALKVEEEAAREFDKIQNELTGRLPDPEEREIFGAVFGAVARDHLASIQRHRVKESEIFRRDTLKAEIDNRINDAVVKRLDPEYTSVQEKSIAANVGDLNLGNPEAAKLETRRELTRLHMAIAEAHALTDPEMGLTHLQTHREKLEALPVEKLEKKLGDKAKVNRAKGRAVDAIQSGADPEEYAAGIEDPEERDVFRGEYQVRKAATERASKKVREQWLEGKIDALIMTPDMEIPSDVLGADRLRLLKIQDELLRKQGDQSHEETYQLLVGEAEQGKLDVETLVSHASKLSRDDYGHLKRLIKDGGLKRKEWEERGGKVQPTAETPASETPSPENGEAETKRGGGDLVSGIRKASKWLKEKVRSKHASGSQDD